MSRRTPLFLSAALIALAVGAAAIATAAVYGPGIPTRPQYVAKAEKTCKRTDKQMAKLSAAANKDAKSGDAKGAGKKFGQLASAFSRGVGLLVKLPKPTADRAILTKWLKNMKVDAKLLKAEAKAYQAGNAAALAKAVKAASKHGKKTNAMVSAFGFRACLVAA